MGVTESFDWLPLARFGLRTRTRVGQSQCSSESAVAPTTMSEACPDLRGTGMRTATAVVRGWNPDRVEGDLGPFHAASLVKQVVGHVATQGRASSCSKRLSSARLASPSQNWPKSSSSRPWV